VQAAERYSHHEGHKRHGSEDHRSQELPVGRYVLPRKIAGDIAGDSE
jgi:hypothetical protein